MKNIAYRKEFNISLKILLIQKKCYPFRDFGQKHEILQKHPIH